MGAGLRILGSDSPDSAIGFLIKVLVVSPILVLKSKYQNNEVGFVVSGRGLGSGFSILILNAD